MKYTEEQLSIIKAAEFNEEGCAINVEVAYKNGSNWEQSIFPTWQFTKCDYRIKPGLKYRPYSKPNKEWIGKVVKKGNGYYVIDAIENEHNSPPYVFVSPVGWEKLQDFFDNYTWEDGTPCGELIEEGK